MANIREIILNILIEYDKESGKKATLLKDALEKYDYLETRDKSFIKRVVDGCLERNIQIDYIINSFSKTETGKMQPFIRSLMRMGTYQIMFMDSVPDSAACNEAVKLAEKHRFHGLKGFVNGVLRNISRNKDKIVYPDKSINDGIDYLSVLYSVPEWICRMWLEEYGFERTESILQFFLQARPTTIRVAIEGDSDDRSKAIADRVGVLKADLESAGVVVKPNSVLDYALDLEKTDNIKYLPGYDKGLFAVQDVSSMLVTEIAAPKLGQVVIDVCSAPGGKTMHAAQQTGVQGRVIARDVSERKCDLVKENAERLGLSNIEIKAQDGRIHDKSMENSCDVLYLDLPCSGLGIIGRKNDIKKNIKQSGLKELSKLQWEIIKASWDYVRVGGTLMYSTCTVDKMENEDIVDRLCREFSFEREDITEFVPAYIRDNADTRIKESMKKGYIQLLPGEYGTDGFFIAKLKRKA